MSTGRQGNAPFPTITKQEVARKYNQDGHPEKHWTVHLRHHDGTESHVELPDSQYTAPNVQALAQDEANRVADVNALSPAGTQTQGQ